MAERPDTENAFPEDQVKLKESDIATLCNELTSISDWVTLGVNLGVPYHLLKEIRSNYAIEGLGACRLEMLVLWLRRKSNASWQDVAGALRQMGENTVAERIEQKYILARIPTSPATSAGMDSETSGATQPESSSAKSPLSPSATAVASRNTIMIQGSFSKLVTKSCKSLQSRGIDVEDVQMFLITMYSSPGSGDGNDMVLTVLESAKSINEIFRALGKYKLWDYLNYYLLQSIIEHFVSDDDELTRMMKQYQQDLTGYTLTLQIPTYLDSTQYECSIVTMSDDENSADELVPALKHNLFKELSVKIDANVNEHSVDYITNLWQSLANQFALPRVAMILHKVAEGCIGITWLIPANLVEYVTRMAQKTSNIFAEKHILRVMLEEQCIYPELSPSDSEPSLPETKLALKTKSSLPEPEAPQLETKYSLLKTKPSLLETKFSLLEAGHHLLKTKPPLLEMDSFQLETEHNLVKTKPPLLEVELLPLKTKFPPPEFEAAAPRKVQQPPLQPNPPQIPPTPTQTTHVPPSPRRPNKSLLQNSTIVPRGSINKNGPSGFERKGRADHSYSTPHATHGYECRIIDPPAWAEALQTNCPICLQVLRNPRQTDCGHIFCEVCIGQAQVSHKQTCPECKQTTNFISPHESLRRLLNDLHVQCTSQNEEGVCDWTGKLRELDDHLNLNPAEPDQLLTGCKFVSLQCEFRYVGCEAEMSRNNMAIHMEENQSHHIELLAEKVKKQDRHIREQDRQLKEQIRQIEELTAKLQMKDEETAFTIQQMREEFTLRLQSKDEEMVHKMKETSGLLQSKDKEETQQKQVLKSTPHIHPINFCFTMDKFKHHRRKKKEWYSEPFHTHPQGYKMRIRIDARGFESSKFVSLYVCIMRGKYDDELSWPFHGKITILLLNQKADNNHFVHPVSYDESIYGLEYRENADRVRHGEQHYGLGSHEFISYDTISQKSPTVQYLKDDCLKFQVCEVQMYS